MSRHFVWLLLFAIMNGCAVPDRRPEDPLVERIFRTSDGAELTREDFIRKIEQPRVVYLGEKHDNARHHQLQLSLIEELVERGQQPAIGFELFSLEQTSLLMRYVSSKTPAKGHGESSNVESRLRKALGWSDDDERWRFYGPILQLAREKRLIVFGADLTPAMRRRITEVGTAGLTRVERRLLYPSGFQNPAYEALMRSALKQAHCGYGDEDYIGRLYGNWVARNDAMAMAIVETLAQEGSDKVVMILGAGHVRNNMGVYERVVDKLPDVRQLNLGFREVGESPAPIEAYIQGLEIDGTRFAPDHEYLWFSTRASVGGEDPCEAFRSYIKKSKPTNAP
jgi:uncharacterized iron-regulated protein